MDDKKCNFAAENKKILPMKKLTLILSVLMSGFSALAQTTYLINFAGTGASTTIDSVIVENLVLNTKVKLAGTDVLRLIVTVGINDVTEANQLELLSYPNPFNNQTRVSFYAQQDENATISVSNLAGQTVAQLAADVKRGKNNFTFAAAATGVYFVNVTAKSGSYTKKVVCNASNNTANSIEFTGTEADKLPEYAQTKQIVQQVRNGQATVDMAYGDDDVLKFTGYSHEVTGVLTTIVTDVPTSSRMETFMFIVCMDADSNHYPIVKIGDQYWMAQNLRTTKYQDKTPIIHAADTATWINTYEGAYCTLNDVGVTNGSLKEGYFYNWWAASEAMDVSPYGWHVPVEDEWWTMLDFLSFNNDTLHGLALKSTKGWDTYDGGKNGNGIDKYGFNILPAGDVWIYGDYADRGTFSYFWSNEECGGGTARLVMVENFNPYFWIGYGPQKGGLSLRCVKNP
jgi:uncharacterized protein (TIGR02145 family)